MSGDYELIKTPTDDEAAYPKQVRQKLDAYKAVGLKYNISKDPLMKRAIVFEAKKQMRPETYQMTIQRIFRLKDEYEGQEYVIYDTYEKVLDDTNHTVDDNLTYGIDLYLEAEPITDKVTGTLKGKTITTSENRYTMKYSPSLVKSIFAKQHKKSHIPFMYVGVTSTNSDKKWSGDNFRVKTVEAFTNAKYDELLLMGMTHTSTVPDAMASAKTIRDDRSMSNIINKEKILEVFRTMSDIITTDKSK